MCREMRVYYSRSVRKRGDIVECADRISAQQCLVVVLSGTPPPSTHSQGSSVRIFDPYL